MPRTRGHRKVERNGEGEGIVRTRAFGLARVDGEPHLTTLAHGRAMLGAGGAGFGRTVRTTAYVG